MEIRRGDVGIDPAHPGLQRRRSVYAAAQIVNAVFLLNGFAAAVVAEFRAKQAEADFGPGTQGRKTEVNYLTA